MNCLGLVQLPPDHAGLPSGAYKHPVWGCVLEICKVTTSTVLYRTAVFMDNGYGIYTPSRFHTFPTLFYGLHSRLH